MVYSRPVLDDDDSLRLVNVMISAARARDVFTELVRKKTVITPIGRRRIYSFHIRVYSGCSTSVVSLECDCGFPYTLARTYPMSPKNAYRLVVGL